MHPFPRYLGPPLLLVIGSALALAAPPQPAAAPAVTFGNYAGSRATLLAIDDCSLPLKSRLCTFISKPAVRAEAVLTPDHDNPHATDSIAVHFYGTVLHENGKFRMWYFGLSWKKPLAPQDPNSVWERNFQEGPICYAESPDGIAWTRPKLGQVERNGGSDNNAIALPDTMTEGAFLIKDTSDPDPGRRYKMIYENSAGPHPVVNTAVSADGLHWTALGTAEHNLEPSSFYEFNGRYTISAQNTAHFGEGGHRTGRQGFVWISPDFRRWLPEAGEAFLLPEPANPNDRGGDKAYVQAHLGVGAVSYGNVLVGLYCQWHARPGPGDWFGYGRTYGDFGLVVSNDGQHFREPVKGHVFLDRHDSSPAMSPDVRYENILTQAGNGILNVGDETRIYHGRWSNTEKLVDYYGEIALATLPRDRWGALGLAPHATEGSVWTAPLAFNRSGGQVTLNATGVKGITVEVADENFGLLPDFSGKNAGVAQSADGLDCAVAWPRASLDALQGRKVRLLLHLHKGDSAEPRLYALYATCE